MRVLFSLVLTILVSPALASVSVSKEYPFSPQLFERLERSLVNAGAREPEMQDYPIAIKVDEANKIALWCPPHTPDSQGRGCSLNFVFRSNELTFTIKKGVVLSITSRQIQAQLNAVNPNTTYDHQQFGSLFEPTDSFGSHFYCQPEGSEGAKEWHCYLFVHEEL